MRFDIITLFPDLFTSFLTESIIGKALAKKLFAVNLVSPREFTTDKHHTADDRPYGGGPGMVLKPEPLAAAIRSVFLKKTEKKRRVIFLTPSGQPFNQAKARELAGLEQLVLVCGRYEGFDQRAIDLLADEEISLGDYVLNGGEVPAMALIEATARLRPGFMGCLDSAAQESHSDGLLEYPHYTRPAEFEGLKVPEVLKNGHHMEVANYRLAKALNRTLERRPELLAKANLSPEALKILARAGQID